MSYIVLIEDELNFLRGFIDGIDNEDRNTQRQKYAHNSLVRIAEFIRNLNKELTKNEISTK